MPQKQFHGLMSSTINDDIHPTKLSIAISLNFGLNAFLECHKYELRENNIRLNLFAGINLILENEFSRKHLSRNNFPSYGYHEKKYKILWKNVQLGKEKSLSRRGSHFPEIHNSLQRGPPLKQRR